ncbi:MAG: acyl-ACP--UDP-N-acetylglucosamine O-acyltransferase [Bacteroides sp.]|nr:acyl-ACP--UDP-N-acetylglucosamine O-acyltransferase [Bacteroides sp.]MCM1095630.1 acyl-ACP--UDP-N-acetylglucosamine O-acyltransferase [Terasakiella sp.]
MISPLAHVDPSAKIGKDVTIHPFAFVDRDTVIGDGSEIMPYASIMRGSQLGSNNKIYQGAIIGADPQDFRWKGQDSFCYLGDNNVIREHVIINRGFAADGGTRIDNNCFVMADSHIGHDSHISDYCVVGNGVTIAGSVEVAHGTILSSNAILNEGVRVGALAMVKGGCRISSNVPPYVIMAHNPAAYYGVNAVILGKHAGYSADQIDDIAKAYRHIYQSSTSLFNALARIEADIDPSAVRDEIVTFVRDTAAMRIAGERYAGD